MKTTAKTTKNVLSWRLSGSPKGAFHQPVQAQLISIGKPKTEALTCLDFWSRPAAVPCCNKLGLLIPPRACISVAACHDISWPLLLLLRGAKVHIVHQLAKNGGHTVRHADTLLSSRVSIIIIIISFKTCSKLMFLQRYHWCWDK